MDAIAEREVMPRLAMDIEPVGILEPTLIAIRRRRQQQHDTAGFHDLAMVLDVLGDVARLDRRRALVTQQLLDRFGIEGRILDQLASLVGMLGQHLAGPSDQPRRRLVARCRDRFT